MLPAPGISDPFAPHGMAGRSVTQLVQSKRSKRGLFSEIKFASDSPASRPQPPFGVGPGGLLKVRRAVPVLVPVQHPNRCYAVRRRITSIAR
jgi:hypothetical protein